MTDQGITPEDKLQQARDELLRSAGGIQVVGRPLKPEEERLVDAINQAVKLIDEALKVLAEAKTS